MFSKTAVLQKLFDIRFSYKHCNFSRVCLLVKMASKTVTRSTHSALSARASGFRENARLPRLYEPNQSLFSGFCTRNIREKTKDYLNMSNKNLLHRNLDLIKSKPMLVVRILNNSLKDTKRKVFDTDTSYYLS